MTACMDWFLYGTLAVAAEIPDVTLPNSHFHKATQHLICSSSTITMSTQCQAHRKLQFCNLFNSLHIFTDNTLYMVQSTIPETHLQAKSLCLHSNTSSPQTEPCGITNRPEINEKTVNNCTLQKCHHWTSEQNRIINCTAHNLQYS